MGFICHLCLSGQKFRFFLHSLAKNSPCMKKILPLLILLLTVHGTHAQDANIHFKQLRSLEGNWTMQTRRGPLFESWMIVNDSCLRGKTYRLMNNTDTILLEEVQIVQKGTAIFYIPIVEGQNNGEPVLFKFVKIENGTFTFDNPEHDFPQRVIYQLPKNDSLHAWIEGLDKGSYRKTEFYYKKIIR
jgi:Domain of unknown function (DUF6265)